MLSIRQSVSWWCYVPRLLTPDQLMRAAADIGYEALELVDPEYWALAKTYGLKIASHRGHRSLTQGLNRREHHPQILAELRENIALAAEWGVPNVICFSGDRAGLDDETGIEITAEGLNAAADMASAAGVTLALELLNSKVDHPDYQADHTAWGVRVCERVGSPNVRLLYDIYHMQVMEGDIIRTIRDHHAYFAHYHTAGNPGRGEIDDSQELNYRAIVSAINETGYTGYLGQEFVPTGDPIAGLKAAFDLCNRA